MISIHALLAESDLFLRCGPMTRRYFYPRSPCGERHTPYALESWPDSISIHALLAESDSLWVWTGGLSYISIHALLAESDVMDTLILANAVLFLSTLSLRRATYLVNTYHRIFGISIHALLAESDNLRVVDGSKSSIISIHALLAESDGGFGVGSWPRVIFLSTLSLRRATNMYLYGILYL